MTTLRVTQQRRAAVLVQVAVALFLLACGAAQWARADLDPVRHVMSSYLTGPGGALVSASYVLLAASLMAIAAAVVSAPRGSRELQPAVAGLMGVAGLSLLGVVATAVPPDLLGPPDGIGRSVHRWSAQTAFAAITVAVALQTLVWALQARTTPWPVGRGLALGVVVLYPMQWVLSSLAPRGLLQKAMIVVSMLWLWWAMRRIRSVHSGRQ